MLSSENMHGAHQENTLSEKEMNNLHEKIHNQLKTIQSEFKIWIPD